MAKARGFPAFYGKLLALTTAFAAATLLTLIHRLNSPYIQKESAIWSISSGNYRRTVFSGGNFSLAGSPGLEPRLAVLETAVLPLNYDPMAGVSRFELESYGSKPYALTN